MAISISESPPIYSASYVFPLNRVTFIFSAPLTTCSFVNMCPSLSKMNPEPSELCFLSVPKGFCCSPKNLLKNSSIKGSTDVVTVFSTSILTTASAVALTTLITGFL